jgi:CBS domain-containing protein
VTSDCARQAIRPCLSRWAGDTLAPSQPEESIPMTTTDDWRLAAPPESRDDDPLVTSLMTHRIVGITVDVSPSTVLRLMAEGGIRHLPVFDGTRCCGLLLETDVVGHLLAGVPAERSAGSIAHLVRAAPTVTTAARRSGAARRMQDGGLDAVLVTEEGRLVGIVTATDLVRSLAGPLNGSDAGTVS